MDSFTATNGDTIKLYKNDCGIVDVTVTGPRGAVKSFIPLSREQSAAMLWFLVPAVKALS